jgi:hypothetical protein
MGMLDQSDDFWIRHCVRKQEKGERSKSQHTTKKNEFFEAMHETENGTGLNYLWLQESLCETCRPQEKARRLCT